MGSILNFKLGLYMFLVEKKKELNKDRLFYPMKESIAAT